MTRHLMLARLLATTIAVVASSVAHATDVDAAPAPPAHLVVLSDEEMATLRGGFSWGGMAISFGADMQTFLDGKLALHTVVRWTSAGAVSQTTFGNGIAPAMLAQLQSQLPGAINVPATLAGNQVYLANNGQTALVQGFRGGLQNILLNTTNGLTASQQTNATITLSNYAGFASMLRTQSMGNALGAEVARGGR